MSFINAQKLWCARFQSLNLGLSTASNCLQSSLPFKCVEERSKEPAAGTGLAMTNLASIP